MSLIDAKYITGARERHGAHYYSIGTNSDGSLKMGMKMRVAPTNPQDKMCNDCFWTPFNQDTKTCLRCGGEIG